MGMGGYTCGCYGSEREANESSLAVHKEAALAEDERKTNGCTASLCCVRI